MHKTLHIAVPGLQFRSVKTAQTIPKVVIIKAYTFLQESNPVFFKGVVIICFMEGSNHNMKVTHA